MKSQILPELHVFQDHFQFVDVSPEDKDINASNAQLAKFLTALVTSIM